MSNKETKNQILAVASQLFGNYGYYRTSITAIARKSYTTKGSVYYHFKTKELLFMAVLANEITPIKITLLQVVDDDKIHAEDKMNFLLKHRIYLLREARNYNETLRVCNYNQYEFLKDFQIEWDGWMKDQMQKIINQGVDEGIFRVKQSGTLLDSFSLLLNGFEISLFFQTQCKNVNPYIDAISRSLIINLKKT